ncbi:MAG: head-tail adaptor protein [Taibaiella sp.]|nr:head-tail adaptor protein [Taibaiella sp.]
MAVIPDYINAGLLREVIVFIQDTEVDTDSGGATDSYTTFLTTRGKLRKRSGRRVLEAGFELFDDGYELVVRYQATLLVELDKNTLKVVNNGKTFTIASYEIQEQRFKYIIFRLNE